MKRVYADYAAVTPTDQRVVEVMLPYFSAEFANPSSQHTPGRTARLAVETARQDIADFIGAKTANEIYFTGSGTESNNLAIIGVAKANSRNGRHIITSAIEHPSVLNACRALEKEGWTVTYLPVDRQGLVTPVSLEQAMRTETVLVSIHLANSEIGVIQDVSALTEIAHRHQAVFHTDACQAASFQELNILQLGVDLLTFNGTKCYGPKGIGVLYVRDGLPIFPIVYGGGQERSLRSGTENVPGIIGLAQAVKIICDRRQSDSRQIKGLRDEMQAKLTSAGAQINVSQSPRLPNHLSVTLPATSTTDLAQSLDQLGVAVSAGSACSSASLSDSHVLTAIGLTPELIHKTIRISLGRATTSQDIETIAQAIIKIAGRP